MSKIAYDPVKDRFAVIIRNSRVLRRIFYFLLDLFFYEAGTFKEYLKKQLQNSTKKKSGNYLMPVVDLVSTNGLFLAVSKM